MSDFTAPEAGWYTTDPAGGWRKVSAEEIDMRVARPDRVTVTFDTMPHVSAYDMTTWLRAQIGADKAAALAAGSDDKAREWTAHSPYDSAGYVLDGHGNHVAYDEGVPTEEEAIHIAIHDPRDVIADCDAKLRLLDLHQPFEGFGGGAECEACGLNNNDPVDADIVVLGDGDFWPCATVRVLASGYRHRDGWLPGWDDLPDE